MVSTANPFLKLEAKVAKMDLQVNKERDLLVCPPGIETCPLVTTIAICLLALLNASELTPIHWQQIEMQLLQYFKAHQNENITVE